MSVFSRPGDDAVYINSATLKRRFDGASDMWVHRRIRDDGFPTAVYFGTPQRWWRIADVLAWEHAMIERGCKPTKRRLVRR